jgi:hypothetical protein
LALTARQVVGSAASERLLGESLEEVLRHTCATLLLSKNVNPKIVSEMLGHATIAIALDTYSHVLPNMQDSAAKAMEDALSQSVLSRRGQCGNARAFSSRTSPQSGAAPHIQHTESLCSSARYCGRASGGNNSHGAQIGLRGSIYARSCIRTSENSSSRHLGE